MAVLKKTSFERKTLTSVLLVLTALQSAPVFADESLSDQVGSFFSRIAHSIASLFNSNQDHTSEAAPSPSPSPSPWIEASPSPSPISTPAPVVNHDSPSTSTGQGWLSRLSNWQISRQKFTVSQHRVNFSDPTPADAQWVLYNVIKTGSPSANYYYKVEPNGPMPQALLAEGAGSYVINVFYTSTPESGKGGKFLAQYELEDSSSEPLASGSVTLPGTLPADARWVRIDTNKESGEHSVQYLPVSGGSAFPSVSFLSGPGRYQVLIWYSSKDQLFGTEQLPSLSNFVVSNDESAKPLLNSLIQLPGNLPMDARWLQVRIQKDGGFTSEQNVAIAGGSALPVLNLASGPGKYRITTAFGRDARRVGSAYQFFSEYFVTNRDSEDHLYGTPSLVVQSDDPSIVKIASEQTAGASTDRDKALRLHDWEASQIRYDFEGLQSGGMDYKSLDALSVLQSGWTICNGYSDLFAALARAAGLKTKVVFGKVFQDDQQIPSNLSAEQICALPYDPTHDHAWNEVLIDGQWLPVDVTFDSGNSTNGKNSGFTHFDSDRARKYFGISSEDFALKRRVKCVEQPY